MPYRRRSNVPKRKTGKRNFRSKKQVKISAPVKSYVNRIVHRNLETKCISNQYTLANFNAKINSSADIIQLLPALTIGTSQNARIGNKVRPVRMEITGYVVYNGIAASLNQDARMLGARLFVFTDKTTRAYTNAIFNYNLLNLGGTSSSFDGTPLNWVSPHNSDQFRFFADKKMKILKPFGYTANATPTSSNAITGMDGSMFHPFKIVLTQKQLPAVLSYDQTDDPQYPSNFAPFIALGYADLNNATADTTVTQISMEFNCTLYFKDA